ncbi:MAG TPA: 2'-5' RNA ligase family protein, partial [Nocardioidaceae bacterium]|nr:2'-5' RNA ligase family protein [Nocardioidaceae bacterium]
SVLQVPVPEAEFVVRPRLARRSPEYLPAEPRETVAHITLLGPFADLTTIDDGLVSELRSFFADVLPFTFELSSICTFPGGGTYLSPEPAAPFHHLTHELHRRFPEFPPYGGAFDDVIPHLSVPVPDGEDPGMLDFELGPRLPLTAHAREAALYWWEPGRCRTLETFGFGTSAA